MPEQAQGANMSSSRTMHIKPQTENRMRRPQAHGAAEWSSEPLSQRMEERSGVPSRSVPHGDQLALQLREILGARPDVRTPAKQRSRRVRVRSSNNAASIVAPRWELPVDGALQR